MPAKRLRHGDGPTHEIARALLNGGVMAIESQLPSVELQEKELVEKHKSLAPRVIHEAIRSSGEEELERPTSALAWSGLAAGLSMGFSFVTEALLRAYLPDNEWRRLIVALGYPVGFVIVIMGRQQLFTENTLTAVIPFMAHANRKTLGKVLRLWFVVLVSNIAGAHLFALTVAKTRVFQPEIQTALYQLGVEAADVGFGLAILRGIFAGWLIALVVWLMAATEETSIAVIFILTYVVGLAGLTHVIAGSTEVLFLVMTGSLSWWSFFAGYMIPALLGNIIGGVSLVSALNHAQVVSGE
jgi:formate/nitrite transporter FocA (FNT family)